MSDSVSEDVRKRGGKWCAYVDDKLTKAEKEGNPKKYKGKAVGSVQRTPDGKIRMKARACYASKKKANNAMAAAMMEADMGTDAQLRKLIREMIAEADETGTKVHINSTGELGNLKKVLKRGKMYSLQGFDGTYKFVDWYYDNPEYRKKESLLGFGGMLGKAFSSDQGHIDRVAQSYLQFEGEGKTLKFNKQRGGHYFVSGDTELVVTPV